MVWRSFWAVMAAVSMMGLGAASAQTPALPASSPPEVAVPPSMTPAAPDKTPAPSAPVSPAAAPPASPAPASVQSAPQPSPSPTAAAASSLVSMAVAAKVEAALDNALTLQRPGQIGLATVWDGNKFVQCRRTADASIWCEAAGTALQPSLAHVITPARAMRLLALGWTVDPHFGSYVRVFPGSTTATHLTRQVLRVLSEGYDADLDHLDMQTAWVRATPCPPRNGPRQNLAGIINDSAAMARYAIHGCLYAPAAAGAFGSIAEFIGLYGLRVNGEIQRLIVNSGTEGIHLVLSGNPGYVQCAPDNAPPSLYCEAASADSVPALRKLLTPERVAQLHTLGFADPGRGPNYSRTTPIAQADAALLTRELLTILFDVYGYRGKPLLRIATEKGG